ncbi:MAG TPA: FAD-binding oxidoreductase, partial [Tepidisphaeraceae bacterium]|nr:FAD-binding oxidoreductase [Tepidisphaeraceae bacterium]
MTALTPSTNFITDLHKIVGTDHARPAVAADSIDGLPAKWIVEPATVHELSEVLKVANAHKLAVIARGNGTKLNWGNPPRNVDIVLSTNRMNRILEHAAGDMTATVETGCAIADLNKMLALRGQRLALDPLWPDRATIGGIIATNDSGPLRATYGTLRDHLIGITAVLPDGTIAKSGGKVVKNVAGYDLPRLFLGSFGTLAIIAQATLRLYPIAHQTQTLCFTGSAPLDTIITAMRNRSAAITAVQFQITSQSQLSLLVLV